MHFLGPNLSYALLRNDVDVMRLFVPPPQGWVSEVQYDLDTEEHLTLKIEGAKGGWTGELGVESSDNIVGGKGKQEIGLAKIEEEHMHESAMHEFGRATEHEARDGEQTEGQGCARSMEETKTEDAEMQIDTEKESLQQQQQHSQQQQVDGAETKEADAMAVEVGHAAAESMVELSVLPTVTEEGRDDREVEQQQEAAQQVELELQQQQEMREEPQAEKQRAEQMEVEVDTTVATHMEMEKVVETSVATPHFMQQSATLTAVVVPAARSAGEGGEDGGCGGVGCASVVEQGIVERTAVAEGQRGTGSGVCVVDGAGVGITEVGVCGTVDEDAADVGGENESVEAGVGGGMNVATDDAVCNNMCNNIHVVSAAAEEDGAVADVGVVEGGGAYGVHTVGDDGGGGDKAVQTGGVQEVGGQGEVGTEVAVQGEIEEAGAAFVGVEQTENDEGEHMMHEVVVGSKGGRGGGEEEVGAAVDVVMVAEAAVETHTQVAGDEAVAGNVDEGAGGGEVVPEVSGDGACVVAASGVDGGVGLEETIAPPPPHSAGVEEEHTHMEGCEHDMQGASSHRDVISEGQLKDRDGSGVKLHNLCDTDVCAEANMGDGDKVGGMDGAGDAVEGVDMVQGGRGDAEMDSVGTPEKEGVEVLVGHTAEGTGKEEQNIDHIKTEEGREVVGVEEAVSRSSDHRSLNCLNLSALILFRCFCLECLCASVCMCAREQRKRMCACVCFCVGVLYECV